MDRCRSTTARALIYTSSGAEPGSVPIPPDTRRPLPIF
jgi:hypothetical protein